MNSIGVATFEGPNLHAKHGVVRLRIEVVGAPRLAPDLLRHRMAERLPAGGDWRSLRETLEGLAAEAETAAPRDVTLADVLAALTRDLQNEPFGLSLPAWQAPARLPGKLDVLVGLGDPDIGREAAIFACRLARQLFAEPESAAQSEAGEERVMPLAAERTALAGAMAEFRQRCVQMGYNESMRLLLAAARTRGVPARKLMRGRRYLLLGHGKWRVRIDRNASDRTSAFASRLSNDWAMTSRTLERAGIPVPKQYVVERDGDVEAAVAAIGFPLVVKGRTGSGGASVTTGIGEPGDIPAALAKARRHSRTPLIEAHIAGEDHRLTVVDGKMVAAVRRHPAQVRGDGERSIAGVSHGGLPEDVTEAVHPEVAALAERAARTVGLDIAGVGVLTTDIARPPGESGAAVISVDCFPHIVEHYLAEPAPREIALDIIDCLFPPPARGRVPMAAVTGTNGKTTTCRMLARILTEAGHCTAQVTTAGAYVGQELVLNGDYANAAGAHAVLQDPRVEAAVLETARGGILRLGLGWERCDVAAVTNIAEDHLHQDGIESLEDLAEVKGLIVEHAGRAVVLNADDPHCRRMAARASAAVWWVSSASPTPSLVQEHLDGGGNALFLEGEGTMARLLHGQGTRRREIAALSELPATLDGTARHNLENAMIAAAAALAMGIPMETLRRGLSRFTVSFADSPGRLNIRDVGGARIVMDHAHNPHGMAQIAATLAAMPVTGRRLCLFMASTRQSEAAIAKLAASAAPHYQGFLVSEAFRPRAARPSGQVSFLLRDGLVAAGIAEDAIIVEPDEQKAVARALALVRPGDLLLLLVDKYEATWAEIEALELQQTATNAR